MTSAGYVVPNEEEIDLKEVEAFGPSGKGTDGLGEKETDKQPNEQPTDKPHAWEKIFFFLYYQYVILKQYRCPVLATGTFISRWVWH